MTVCYYKHTPAPTYIYHGSRVYMVHNHTVAVTLYILTPSWDKHAMILYHILLNFSFVIFFLFFLLSRTLISTLSLTIFGTYQLPRCYFSSMLLLSFFVPAVSGFNSQFWGEHVCFITSVSLRPILPFCADLRKTGHKLSFTNNKILPLWLQSVCTTNPNPNLLRRIVSN